MNSSKSLAINAFVSAVISLFTISAYNHFAVEREAQIRDEISELTQGYPPIRVLNFERMTSELLAQNYTPKEVVEYGELMIRYFADQGYLVLESQAIVTQPQHLKLNLISLQELRDAADKLGIRSATGQVSDRDNGK